MSNFANQPNYVQTYMRSMHKVSVIIPTYNYAHFIAEAVESVLTQTFPIFEIIVVDDGSSDNTEEVIKQFGDKVRYIRQKNGGVGLARNTGVKNSAGEFIAFLDADDIWLPQKIEHQIQLFQTDDEIGLITTAMRELYVKGKTIRIYAEGKNGWCADNLLLLEPVVVGPGSTTLVKRKIFEQIGGFDETKELHPSEDWEFCYRVARQFKLAFLPEILVEYRNHGNNGHLQIPRFERAMTLAFEKIFSNDAAEIQKLKEQSYSNLHKMLAGSYFLNKHYRNFFKHSFKSVWLMPTNISYFFTFPLRRFRKRRENTGIINANKRAQPSLPSILDRRNIPKISVVIPTYNYANFIAEAVESVLTQTFPIFEIIVVDDGSSDNTEEVIKQFGDKVRYIKQKNGGVCAARNTGVKNASGDFIAFLDADDAWLAEKIEKQIAKFGEDSQIGLVHCEMREFDTETGETVRLHIEGEEGWVADELLLFEKPVVIGCGGSIMVSRKAFEAVGGFDTNLTVGEDWDFCYRIAKNFKVGFVREILVDYRNHGNNSHLNIPEMERSMKIFYEKAFDTNDKNILRLHRKSYGNFYKILAGSYYTNKNYQRFIKYSLKSLWLMPENISYFLAFPLRRLKKSYENKSNTAN